MQHHISYNEKPVHTAECLKYLRVMEIGVPGPILGLGENDNSPMEPDLHRTTEFSLGAKSKYVTCTSNISLVAFVTGSNVNAEPIPWLKYQQCCCQKAQEHRQMMPANHNNGYDASSDSYHNNCDDAF
jgi:hypothetical protein